MKMQTMWSTLVSVIGIVLVQLNALGMEPNDVVDVEPVWSGHRVSFALLTDPPNQYVAYYDAQRQLTVAQRKLKQTSWTFTKLPTHIGWDSHNYVTMAVDREGYLHVSGNMHCVPLIYFRSTKQHDAQSLQQVTEMVGPQRERRVTYPVFLRGPENQLIFRYRDGRSGNGDDIYNAYNESRKSWNRLLDQPLTSGRGKMNAYCSKPRIGPDGKYHIVWVWRDTSDCATNHDLSYARSADLVHWETADGTPLTLPITIDSGAVVDPVPPQGGMINGGVRLGFDARDRPLVVYHKYDAAGDTQIYIARCEDREWTIKQLSDWVGYRWEFSGGGSIPFEVRLGGIVRVEKGLRINCTYGRGRASWLLDAVTLEPVPESGPAVKPTPGPATAVRTQRTATAPPKAETAPTFPGLQRCSASDLGGTPEATHRYRLQWYSLGSNRDRPHTGPLPPPSMLRVLKSAN